MIIIDDSRWKWVNTLNKQGNGNRIQQVSELCHYGEWAEYHCVEWTSCHYVESELSE